MKEKLPPQFEESLSTILEQDVVDYSSLLENVGADDVSIFEKLPQFAGLYSGKVATALMNFLLVSGIRNSNELEHDGISTRRMWHS